MKCQSLEDLKDVFDSFVHTGPALKSRKGIRTKSSTPAYFDLTKLNDFIVRSVFDTKGNYLYHRECIRTTFGVSNQRLAHLRKGIQVETGDPTELLPKHVIYKSNHFSDVLLPRDCELTSKSWLDSQPDGVLVKCRKNPRRHGNARKTLNHTKSHDIKEMYVYIYIYIYIYNMHSYE